MDFSPASPCAGWDPYWRLVPEPRRSDHNYPRSVASALIRRHGRGVPVDAPDDDISTCMLVRWVVSVAAGRGVHRDACFVTTTGLAARAAAISVAGRTDESDMGTNHPKYPAMYVAVSHPRRHRPSQWRVRAQMLPGSWQQAGLEQQAWPGPAPAAGGGPRGAGKASWSISS